MEFQLTLIFFLYWRIENEEIKTQNSANTCREATQPPKATENHKTKEPRHG
jgi:hypothetical protein